MKQSMKELKRISPRAWTVSLLFCLAIGARLESSPKGLSDVKFEVVSVRVLTDQEALDRSPDFIGPNVAVRLRLSTSNRGVSFCGYAQVLLPIGFQVKWTDQGRMLWVWGNLGPEERPTSPGLEPLTSGFPAVWHSLYANSALEWEELDSTSYAGEKHAFTVFLRRRDEDSPVELVSDPYMVPDKP